MFKQHTPHTDRLRKEAAELAQARLSVPLSFLQYADALAKLCDEAIYTVELLENSHDLAKALAKQPSKQKIALGYCRELLADLPAKQVRGTRVWKAMQLILEAQGEFRNL